MRMPEDYQNGVQGMIEDKDGLSDPYADLTPLVRRQTTEVKLKTADGEGDAALALKYGYSQPITQVSRLTQKLYGYERDANVQGHLAQSAVKGTNALNDLIFDAPCVNRQGRWDEEEGRAKQWMKLIELSPKAEGDDETSPDIDTLLQRWSEADAFMLQARIVEEQRGIDAAEPLYEKYSRMAKQRDEVQMGAAELPPAYNMLFWCRLRQYGIMRERAYDLAMGYPTHEFTDVKCEISEGHDIHDLVHRMPWPFRESYQLVTGSMMDGEAHRTLLMAMIAGQLPPQPMPWGMGYWPGMPPNGGQPEEEGEEGESQPDKRPALFKVFGTRKGGAPEQPKPIRRRASRRRNR